MRLTDREPTRQGHRLRPLLTHCLELSATTCRDIARCCIRGDDASIALLKRTLPHEGLCDRRPPNPWLSRRWYGRWSIGSGVSTVQQLVPARLPYGSSRLTYRRLRTATAQPKRPFEKLLRLGLR
jgi:hypothetical protein